MNHDPVDAQLPEPRPLTAIVSRYPQSFLSGSQVCTNEVSENERGRYGVGAQVFAPALLTVSRCTRLVSEEATPPDPASVRRSTSGYRWASQRIGPGTVGQVPRGESGRLDNFSITRR